MLAYHGRTKEPKITVHLIIREASTNAILASAASHQALKSEGNWYLIPAAVNSSYLEVTQFEYVCPYKGRCLYVDAVVGGTRIPRVAWIYDNPKPDWEHIKGRYGFYAGQAAERIGKTIEELQ